MTMTTISQTREIPASFRTNGTQYHNSSLPRTIPALRGQREPTVSYSAYTGLTLTANTIWTRPKEPVLMNTDQIE